MSPDFTLGVVAGVGLAGIVGLGAHLVSRYGVCHNGKLDHPIRITLGLLFILGGATTFGIIAYGLK